MLLDVIKKATEENTIYMDHGTNAIEINRKETQNNAAYIILPLYTGW